MPALRQRKRPASPVADDAASPDPPKRQPKRGKTKAAAQPISDDDDNDAVAAPPQKKTAAKGKTESKAKGKAKSKAKIKDEVDEDDIKEEIDEDEAAPADTTVSSAQYLKNNRLQIPLDEGCAMEIGPKYAVYVDKSTTIIYDASLNQTDSSNNNNKFYRIQLVTNGNDYRTWTRWGRVGEHGQRKVLGNGSFDNALAEFEKKFKDKSGLTWENRAGVAKAKKYVFIERSYEPDSEKEDDDADAGAQDSANGKARSRSASPAKCTLQGPTRSLMEFIFDQQYLASTMADMNYDAEKLPLGKLSKATITRGYEALKSLAELLNDPTLAQSEHGMSPQAATESLSNRYYSYIPHAFGRNRPPIISSHEHLKKEVELLGSLTDLKDADSILKSAKGSEGAHPLDLRYTGLKMQEMTPLDHKSDEFKLCAEYLMETKGTTHVLQYNAVVDVFRIQRQGEFERFDQAAKKNSDRRLLWHGSRSTNYGGILSQGLRIAPPEAPVSGYMFGKGIYLADMSSKSANYCWHHASGGEALLLLCEAELGSPMQELTDASYEAGETAAEQGMISTWGKGEEGPSKWRDAGCIHPSLKGVQMPDVSTKPGETNFPGAYLQYNEYICYDVSQVRLRYLLRVKMGNGY